MTTVRLLDKEKQKTVDFAARIAELEAALERVEADAILGQEYGRVTDERDAARAKSISQAQEIEALRAEVERLKLARPGVAAITAAREAREG